jgi:GNAT superfamily N-acetyltransferase
MDTLKRALQRHGVIKCCSLATAEAVRSVVNHLYLHERHVWFLLPTHNVRVLALAEGMVLQPAAGSLVDRLLEEGLCGRRVAAKYLRHRGEPWVVMDGQRAAFCCWIFTNEMPLVAARGGWQPLQGTTACLEDSVTAADYRGRGIAPAAWLGIAAILKDRGIDNMITKVEVDNMASQRAVLKAGFHEIAVMDYRRISLWRHKMIEPLSILQLSDLETLKDLQMSKA